MQKAFYRYAAGSLCFIAVLIAWVFFRAESFTGAWNMLQAMSQVAEIPATMPVAMKNIAPAALPVLGLAMFVTWFLPNLQEWMARDHLVLSSRTITPARVPWSRTWWWGIAAALPAAAAMYKLIYMSNSITEFIYFQF